MTVTHLSAYEITCDTSGCDADFLTDPPRTSAITQARANGWAVHEQLAHCPSHRHHGLTDALRRQGGLARAAALTPERRSEIARMGAQARWGARQVARGRWYPEMPPGLPGEDDDAYTDRLTGADGTDRRPYDHVRNRQCSIGYHDECTDPTSIRCKCPCHEVQP